MKDSNIYIFLIEDLDQFLCKRAMCFCLIFVCVVRIWEFFWRKRLWKFLPYFLIFPDFFFFFLMVLVKELQILTTFTQSNKFFFRYFFLFFGGGVLGIY